MSRLLSRSLLIAVALLMLTSNVSAQKNRFSLGPYFMAGASVFSGDVPHTWKTDLKFAWSGGVITTYATSPKFGINLGLALDSRRIFFYEDEDKSVTTQMGISTLDIYTGVKFNDFIIGFDFGFPMSADMKLENNQGNSATAGKEHFSTDSLGMKIEIALGAIFNIVESETGKFQFMIKAMYPLTQMWDKTPYAMRKLLPSENIQVQRDEVDGNTRQFEDGRIPSIQFGFIYQFNLGK
jgi:hypothetical protein